MLKCVRSPAVLTGCSTRCAHFGVAVAAARQGPRSANMGLSQHSVPNARTKRSLLSNFRIEILEYSHLILRWPWKKARYRLDQSEDIPHSTMEHPYTQLRKHMHQYVRTVIKTPQNVHHHLNGGGAVGRINLETLHGQWQNCPEKYRDEYNGHQAHGNGHGFRVKKSAARSAPATPKMSDSPVAMSNSRWSVARMPPPPHPCRACMPLLLWPSWSLVRWRRINPVPRPRMTPTLA
jgi:hypothetical protein